MGKVLLKKPRVFAVWHNDGVKKEYWSFLFLLISILLAVVVVGNGWEVKRRIEELARSSLDNATVKYMRQVRRCAGGRRMTMAGAKRCLRELFQNESETLHHVALVDSAGTEIARFAEKPPEEGLIVHTTVLHPYLSSYHVRFAFHGHVQSRWSALGARYATISFILGGVLVLFGGLVAFVLIRNIRLHESVLKDRHLKEIGMMSSQLSHEIHNPLSSIRGLAQILLEETRHADQREHLETIIKETDRLEQLTTDLLVFARSPQPHPTSTDLRSTITSIIQDLNIERYVELAVPDGEDHVFADPNHVQQILYNLLKNASDVIRDDERITLRINRKEDNTVLTMENPVDDLEPDEISSLFTPFYTTKASGSGLGLFISRKLTELNGGTLTASLVRDRCIQFKVELPYAET